MVNTCIWHKIALASIDCVAVLVLLKFRDGRNACSRRRLARGPLGFRSILDADIRIVDQVIRSRRPGEVGLGSLIRRVQSPSSLDGGAVVEDSLYGEAIPIRLLRSASIRSGDG